MRMTFIAVVTAVIVAPQGWIEPSQAAPWIPGLSRGHNILVQRGLQIQASCDSAVMNFDLNNWSRSNFTSAFFWHTYPTSLLPAAPGIPWGMSSVAAGDITSSLVPYASRLINYQIGDEQDVGDASTWASLRSSMDSFHANRPNVMTYTNQWGSQVSATSLRAYMQAVQPDMLCFDTYPFNGSVTGGSPTGFYAHMQKYRKLGLAGNDGSGSRPIPVGLYTQTYTYPGFEHVMSESEIKLNNFSAWAFGYKLVNDFIYAGNPYSILFSGNTTTTPTPQFEQVAETNRQSRNLGPALVRLISTGVHMIMGKHGSGSTNTRPDDVPAWSSTSVPYITGVSATNLGSKNRGLRGDVIVSTFKPLDASFTNAGHADDSYFMIVNGLTDGDGTAAECQQNIKLTFDFGDSGIDSLLRLNRDTGLVETFNLIPLGGSKYRCDLYLDGGTGHLFKFDNGGIFVPEPSPLGLLFTGLTGLLCYAWRTSYGRRRINTFGGLFVRSKRG